MAPDGKAEGAVALPAEVAAPYDPYNPALPETLRNPYPIYEELRANEPVHWSPRLNMWVLTKYAHVSAVLRDQARFAGGPARLAHFFSGYKPEQRAQVATLSASLGRWALFKDAPEHTRLRPLITKPFLPAATTALRPKIDALTAELLDEVQGRERFDVMETLACTLPVIVIAEMLGLPACDRPLLKHWSDVLASFIATIGRTLESAIAADGAVTELEAYLHALLRERRANPREDLLTMLASADVGEGKLTDDEVVSTTALLLFGGHETTTNLIGNGLLAFLRNEEQWELLRMRPEMVGNAVEEALRYDPPVQFVGRIAKEPVELGGRTILPGELTLNVLAAANRDPAVFADAGEFRIGRESASRHLSFGQGIHFCVGAPLARLEGAAAFSAMATRFPRLRLADERSLRWNPAIGFRRLEKLEVVVG